MKYIKVLALESWQKYEAKNLEKSIPPPNDFYREVPVVFQREGQYLDRHKKTAWWEILVKNEWRAYTTKYLYADFLYTLALLNHYPLSSHEVKEVRKLLDHKRFKSLRMLYLADLDWKTLREIRRDGLSFRKHVKESLAKLEQRGEP